MAPYRNGLIWGKAVEALRRPDGYLLGGKRSRGTGNVKARVREEEPGSRKWGRARPGCWVTLVPTSEHDLEQAPLPLRATVPPAAK